MAENEIWRDVVGFEGQYQVSNKGNVFSVARRDSRGRKCGGLLLKPNYDKDGYLIVDLYENGVGKKKKIHRLVVEAFLPNHKNLPDVNHKDENPSNNELSNLEWCDARYNNSYGTRIERVVQAQSKKVRAVNIETGEVVKFNSTREAGRKGYDQGTVSTSCRGVYKDNRTGKLIGDGHTYRGHRWYYIQQEENK